MTAFRHVWRLAAAFLLLAAVAAGLFSVVPTRADMTILLPERGDGDLALLFRSLRQGPANRTFLIGLAPEDVATAADPRALSRAFKDRLEKSGRFEWVANGEFRQDRAAIEPFFAHRYRLNPPLDPAEFSATGLRSALERLLDLLQGVAAPAVAEIMTADPTLRTLSVAALWTPPSAPAKQGVWVDAAGRQVLLLARTGATGFDLAAQDSAMAAVRTAADGLEPAFGKLRLALSGPSVIAVESKTVAEAESQRLILISVPLVAGLLVLFLRRIAVLPVLFLPLGCGFLAGAAVVGAVFGYVHVTTLGFGVTLLGVAVDYPLHLLARTRDIGVAEAARRIWPGLLIAVSTTILAFLPLVMSSFPGLAQLGLFSVTGLAVAVAVTRWVLPRLVADRDRAPGPPPIPLPRWLRLLRLPALLAGIAATAVLGLRVEPLWQQDLAVLSPIPEAVRARDQALRGNLQVPDPRYVLTVSAKDVEAALQRSERLLPRLAALRDSKVLDGFEMAALYVPSHGAQAARLAALPPETTLRTHLEQAQQGLPFKPDAFEPFLQALAAARAGPPLSPSDFPEATLRARLEPLLVQAEDGIKALILLRGLRNPAELQRAVEETGTTGVRYLDIKQAAQDLMDDYRDETLRWVSVGGALALALLIATLRATRAVAMVAAPVVLSVLITTAVMAQVAGGLSIFHLLGLLMVAGLGIDYAVFLQEKEGEGVRAVALCAATSIAVFALLATASVPILSQIGWTVAIGSLLSFALGLVFAAPTAERAA